MKRYRGSILSTLCICHRSGNYGCCIVFVYLRLQHMQIRQMQVQGCRNICCLIELLLRKICCIHRRMRTHSIVLVLDSVGFHIVLLE